MPAALNIRCVLIAVIRGKVDIKEEKDFARLVKERAKAREKLQKLCEQVCNKRTGRFFV